MSNNCSILRDWLSWTNDPELNSSLLLGGKHLVNTRYLKVWRIIEKHSNSKLRLHLRLA